MSRFQRFSTRAVRLGAPVALALLIGVSGVALADYKEEHSFEANSLVLNNLIGEIQVTGHGGSTFEVIVRVQGKDSSDAPGLAILAEDGSRGSLTVKFPKADKFVYPALGAGSRTTFTPDGGKSGWLGEIFGGLFGDRITVRGNGSGVEIWADIEVRVPAGGKLDVRHGVGKLFAENVDGDLALAVRSGHVEGSRIRGDLLVDTGSGHVTLADIEGALNVDTGSGHVELERCRGPQILIDTGSGHVDIVEVDAPKLDIDTGSGHVEASRVSTDSFHIDTGSGGVRLQLDRMGSGDYEIDTGSGRVVLAIPRDASIDVQAETGSGGIDLDLEGGVKVRRMDRDEVSFSLGGGESRVRIDTGSGGVRITYSD